jgi:hypothetical protein
MKFIKLLPIFLLLTSCDQGVDVRDVYIKCNATLNKDKIFCVDSMIYIKLANNDEVRNDVKNDRNIYAKKLGSEKFKELSPYFDKILELLNEKEEYLEDARPNFIVRYGFYDKDLSWLGYKIPYDKEKKYASLIEKSYNEINYKINQIENSSTQTTDVNN